MNQISRSRAVIVYQCEYCQKPFLTKSKLNYHRKIHLQTRDFKCSFCDYATYQKSKLDNHIRTHTKERPYKCGHPDCVADFAQTTHLTQHQRLHSKDDGKMLKCSSCPFKTVHKSSLTEHLKTHSDVREFSCDFCPYQARQKSNLKSHHDVVHLKLKRLKCDQPNCKFACSQNAQLNHHQLAHIDNDAEKEKLLKFRCDRCPYKTMVKGSLKRHHEAVHLNLKPLKCDQPNCDFSCSQKPQLYHHQLVHKSQEEKEKLLKFKCDRCPYKTTANENLKKHLLHTHSTLKGYSCDLCPFRSKHATSVRLHKKTVHNQLPLRPFKCPQPNCSFSGKLRFTLNHHMKVHRIYKEFACSFSPCKYETNEKRDLQRHEMAHRGEKPFQCSLCTFSCTLKSSLVSHIRVHTGEAPYPCSSCPYRGKTSSSLTQHLKHCKWRKDQASGPLENDGFTV